MILLPATADGAPDWEYMESYVKSVMEKSKQNFEYLKESLKIRENRG